MHAQNRSDHALITIYGDNDDKIIAKALHDLNLDRDTKILEPDSLETLVLAASNSALIIIGVFSDDDPNLALANMLENNLAVSADVIAFCSDSVSLPLISILAKGFAGCVFERDAAATSDFKPYLNAQVMRGVRRLEELIHEDEYRRLSDALSIAPVSIIIFDADKRAVFVSDHYFRAYPRIAPRLIRGLRVYDAFEMMAREEGLDQNDERYATIRQFWHNLSGTVEFTLDDGTSYRLKAMPLPQNRGTLVTGQNMTGYVRKVHGAGRQPT